MSKSNKVNLSPEAKRRLQNERRRMARESGKQAEREFDTAVSAVRRQESTHKGHSERTAHIALLRNLLSLCRAVNASFSVAVPVRITPREVGRKLHAWTPQQWEQNQSATTGISGRTDMSSIEVTYPLWRDETTGEPVYTIDTNHLLNLISDTKGLQYHELGHILYTHPLRDVVNTVLTQDELWLTMHPEVGYSSSADVLRSFQAIQRSWNILEDQRMETALLYESPYIARYFTKLVLRFILNASWMDYSDPGARCAESMALQYFLVINRRYLPVDVRAKSRAFAVSVLGEDIVAEAEGIVRRYCGAYRPEDLLLETLKFHQLLVKLNAIAPELDSHPMYGTPKNTVLTSADSKDEQNEDAQKIALAGNPEDKSDKKPEDKPEDKSKGKSEDKPEAEDKSDTGADDGSDGEPSSDKPSDEQSSNDSDGDSDSDSESQGFSEGGDRSSSPDTSLNEDITKALEEAQKELSHDSDVEEVVRSINADLNLDGATLLEPETGDSSLLSGLPLDEAEDIGIRLSQSFDSAISATHPVWEEGHRNGLVNAFRYRTRTAGDHNYRRMLASDGNSGLDIAVSLLLDVSGSMRDHQQKLSQVAYAVKSACDRVDISCAVLTFDSQSRELYRKDEKFVVPLQLEASGGTNPIEGLNVLDSHRDGQKYHLVIILTDGMWHHTVAQVIRDQYRDGRVFLGISLGGEYLREMGFHSSVAIQNLESMPEIVRDFLLNFLG